MRLSPHPYDLRPVTTKADWSAFHSIRKRVLWDARGQTGYDPEHPDDRADGKHPFLLWYEGQPIGVLRVDLVPPVAVLRRVAVVEGLQRRGHGRKMVALAEDFARREGCSLAASNVDREAVGFYRRLGYRSTRPDAELWMERSL